MNNNDIVNNTLALSRQIQHLEGQLKSTLEETVAIRAEYAAKDKALKEKEAALEELRVSILESNAELVKENKDLRERIGITGNTPIAEATKLGSEIFECIKEKCSELDDAYGYVCGDYSDIPTPYEMLSMAADIIKVVMKYI